MLTASGLFILCVSSMFNALQAVIEQGIFMKDPELSPMCLCGAEAFWKLSILLLLGPFYKMIAVPKEVSFSGTLEDFGAAIADLESNSRLMNLVIVNALLVGLAHAFGYAIIKYEDAVM